VKSYLARYQQNGISLSLFAFEELNMDQTIASASDNESLISYAQSPTFSQAAYLSFATYLRANGAPLNYYGLPVLPNDYLTASHAHNPALNRIQSVSAGDPLWGYWAEWRRSQFNLVLAEIALQLKAQQTAVSYYRSPLIMVQYSYVGWTVVNSAEFNVATSSLWNNGLYVSSNSENLYVDPGTDFNKAHSVPGAFDYFVDEIKDLPDTNTQEEAGRMVQFAKESPAANIGLHVELEFLNPNTNYGNNNMQLIFPDNTFSHPAFQMEYSWEAQCEFVLSMKQADPGGVETLDVEVENGGFVENNLGNYATLFANYDTEIGDWCLYRHQHYNLPSSSQAVIQENMRRVLGWKGQYLANNALGKLATNNSPYTYYPVAASSNNVLSGWPAANLMDWNVNTSYSSNGYPSASTQNSPLYVAAWIPSLAAASKVVLTARMSNGVPQAFPSAYQVSITNSDNTAWVSLGTFTQQPDANGQVVLNFPIAVTAGVLIQPVTLGVDGYGNHYFSLPISSLPLSND
jgi:hypothetical protein